MRDMPTIISPDTRRKNRIPPGQRLTNKWPVLHHGAVPDIDTAHLVSLQTLGSIVDYMQGLLIQARVTPYE